MARFASFTFTERDSEVHRLGHKYIRNRTGTYNVIVDVQAHYVDKKSDINPDTEFINVEITNGTWGGSFQLLQIKNGKIILPPEFMERIERWNAENARG